MRKMYLSILLIMPLILNALTLEEALKLSIANNKELQMAKEDVEIANRDYRDIKGSLLPQISGQIGIFNSQTNMPKKADIEMPSINGLLDSTATVNEHTIATITDGFVQASLPEMEQNTTQYGTTIKIDQVLYLGGKLLAGIEAAKKFETLTENQFKVKKIDVIFQTKKLYYSTILAEKVLSINKQALQTAEQHLTIVSKMNENGLASQYDFLRAQLEVSKLKPAVIDAENNYSLAKEALAKQIGLAVEEIIITDQIEFKFQQVLSLEQSISKALENRPELILTKLTKEMYGLQYKAEKGNYLPNIVFQAELSHFAEGDKQFSLKNDDFGTSYKYGIGINIPIFTGFSNKAKKEKAHAQLKKSKIQDTDLRELIALDVKNSFQQYQYMLENLDVQSENTILANKGLQIAEVRFKNNIGIQLEVIDAQLQVNIANLSLLNAKFQALIAYEEYQKSIGNLNF